MPTRSRIEAATGGGVGPLRRGLLPPLLPGAARRRGPGRPLPPLRRRAAAWTRASGSRRAVYLRRTPTSPRRTATRSSTTSGFGRAEGRLRLPQPDASADVRDALRGAVAAPAADAARPRADARAPGHRPHRQRRTPPASSAASGPRSSWASCSPTARRLAPAGHPHRRAGRPRDGRAREGHRLVHLTARSSSATSRSTAPARCRRPERDVIMTTSWWTTRAVLDSTLPRDQVVYLLQEDERMFYACGDERLLCQETLAEPDLAVVVNTRRLLDHLTASGAIPHLADAIVARACVSRGIEPAPARARAPSATCSSTPGPRTPATSSGAAAWCCRGPSRSGCWTPTSGTSTSSAGPPGADAARRGGAAGHEGLGWADYQDLVARWTPPWS